MNAFVVILLSLGAAAAVQFGYLKGHRYKYYYQSDIYHAIPGGSAKTLGLRVKCHAYIDVFKKTEMQFTFANLEVFQVTGNRKDPKQQQEVAVNAKVLKAMEHKLFLSWRVIFKAQDWSIKEIYAHPQDEEWSMNIKRGFVNLFQVSPNVNNMEANGKQFVTQHESTAVGECQVSYVFNEQQQAKEQFLKITKVINYDKCRQRPEFWQNTFYGQWCEGCKQSWGYAPYYRWFGQIDHTMTGSKQNGWIFHRTVGFEQHVITPFSRSGGQITASARQILQFWKKDALGQESTGLTKKISLIFFAENPDWYARQNAQYQQKLSLQVEKYVDEMCKAAKDPNNQWAAQKFTAVVYLLRKCNKVTLQKQVEKMLARQDQTERWYCLDAFSFVGTTEAFQVWKELFAQNKITKQEEFRRVFTGLAYAPIPTAYHIETAWELCKHPEVFKDVTSYRHCLFSFGALVYKIFQRPEQDTKAVTACQHYVKVMVDKLANSQLSPAFMLTYIKTLGNAGSTGAREQLLKIVKNQKYPLYIRVNGVWALRRIAPLVREKTFPHLITVFADAKEHPELRMAVFLLMLNSDLNFATLQALVNTVRREITNPFPYPRSNQLASFVISHLSAFAWHDNVLMKKRSMYARMALRLMPRMNFGLGYSKGMRWAQYSEKFQAGFEFEANKFDVPESMFPRNMNARFQFSFLGYRINAFEFGTRVQNMDDIFEQVISQVRHRQKRSLWGSIMSLFGEDLGSALGEEEEEEEEEEESSEKQTRSSTRPSTSMRRRSHVTGSSPRPTHPSSDGEAEHRRVSFYMKLFGDELKFAEMKQEFVDQLAKDFADLFLGKKDKIEYPDYGFVISKDGVVFHQSLEKAILFANARRMLPTLAGIPLDLQFRSSAAFKVFADAKMTFAPSLMSWWHFKKFTGFFDFKPSVHVFADTRIGIHTPFLRVALQMNHWVKTNPYQKVDFEFEAGKKYNLNYYIPEERRDYLYFKANTQGFFWQYMPDTWERKEQPISMEFYTPYFKQWQRDCKGGDMFGFQFCTEGNFPDFAWWRLQQIPVWPTFGQTEFYFFVEPATDKPTFLHWTTTVEKYDNKEMQAVGEFVASSKTVTRRIPYSMIYRKAEWQFEIETKVFQVLGWEDYKMKFFNDHDGVKWWFGKGKWQYQITFFGEIKDQGKWLRLQAKWTELPWQWKNFFYNWQPQIWYFLQWYAWIRRTQQQTKQIAFDWQLTSPLTSNLKFTTPDAEVERTDVSLPVRIDHFPQSIQEIKNYIFVSTFVAVTGERNRTYVPIDFNLPWRPDHNTNYRFEAAKCEVQDQSIMVFDRLQYQHNIRGGCPYVLVQENRKDKQSRIQLLVKIDERGQKTVMATIQLQTQKQSMETVLVKPDLTIVIDGQNQECSQKACQSKMGGATVRKLQTSDGRTQIELSTKLGLHATIDGQRIRVYASPLLHSRVHGLCGDANGEQWNEYKDPKGQVQNLQKFIQSWQQKC